MNNKERENRQEISWTKDMEQQDEIAMLLEGAYERQAKDIHLSEQQKRLMYHQIQKEIGKRRTNMRKFSGKKVVLAVALVAALAAGTAVGAGKIAHLSSGHSVNQVDYKDAKAVMASTKLGTTPKAVEKFADGTKFEAGYYCDVEALDAKDNLVGTYPEINVHYGKGLSLFISRPLEGTPESKYPVVLADSYKGISLEAVTMEYLFLPPDAKPSEADVKRMEEGTLEISYGSSKEERKIYLGVKWMENGLNYNLFTMDDGHDASEMMAKAKEIIDAEK